MEFSSCVQKSQPSCFGDGAGGRDLTDSTTTAEWEMAIYAHIVEVNAARTKSTLKK